MVFAASWCWWWIQSEVRNSVWCGFPTRFLLSLSVMSWMLWLLSCLFGTASLPLVLHAFFSISDLEIFSLVWCFIFREHTSCRRRASLPTWRARTGRENNSWLDNSQLFTFNTLMCFYPINSFTRFHWLRLRLFHRYKGPTIYYVRIDPAPPPLFTLPCLFAKIG